MVPPLWRLKRHARKKQRPFQTVGIDEVILQWRSNHPRQSTQTRSVVGHARNLRARLFLLLLASLAISLAFQTGVFEANGCGITMQSVQPARKVALIDSLSLDMPNPGFVKDIASLSSASGYQFDYYPPANLTFDALTHLPQLGYSILIFRTHGALGEPVVATSMEYSSYSHVGAQLGSELGRVQVNQHQYFGILPGFVTKDMCGRFPGTLVLGMGCTSLGSDSLAKAFVDKGANGFVGWSGWVTQGHTDAVFAHLVKLLLSNNLVDLAVNNTMSTIGPDPTTGSVLTYYPS